MSYFIVMCSDSMLPVFLVFTSCIRACRACYHARQYAVKRLKFKIVENKKLVLSNRRMWNVGAMSPVLIISLVSFLLSCKFPNWVQSNNLFYALLLHLVCVVYAGSRPTLIHLHFINRQSHFRKLRQPKLEANHMPYPMPLW